MTRSSTGLDQRRRILRAVAELVAKRGYADVTNALLVKRARVSYTTFYKHFSDKEECFVALFESAARRADEVVEAQLASDRPWEERVVLACRGLIDLIVDEPIVARAVVVEAPTVGPGLLDRYDGMTKAISPLLREGRDAAPRGHELPETIEDALSGSAFWMAYERLIVGEADKLNANLPALLEFIFRPYLGEAEAGRIARAEAQGSESASA